ncbi:hypothetical protein [Naasia lichenicola]|uniref:Uncharacterized protein n=1 Tax=Naasia lichenicola TaxID=2565933 RepID=A0A4S4FSL8_9MICO|nr:hypothetical protein [Naasia lichenicola]THG32902.1 hypothetical protein E6C64_00570 [Naasia lichenicola]
MSFGKDEAARRRELMLFAVGWVGLVVGVVVMVTALAIDSAAFEVIGVAAVVLFGAYLVRLAMPR